MVPQPLVLINRTGETTARVEQSGTFVYFDVALWARVQREFVFYADSLLEGSVVS
jgi:hypothetical protein